MLDKIKETVSFRQGLVTKAKISNYACCTILADDEEIFRYLELKNKDNVRFFIYEDMDGYKSFAENFHKNRYTSFHEFFTTEELVEEKKPTGLVMKSYKRRGEEDYKVMPLAEAQKLLEENKIKEEPMRLTSIGQYTKEVDYKEA